MLNRDMFKPYSKEIRGDLEAYLREHDGINASNVFYGAKYFFEIKDRGLIIPRITSVRIYLSPAPDNSYFVNNDLLLESNGGREYNVSCIEAKKGIYNPSKILKRRIWSISGLTSD
jgi:hypothetical protein